MTTRETARSPVRWLLQPAHAELPGGQAVSLAGLRILVGVLWLYNVVWKSPPDFGRSSGRGLYGFTRDAVDHPVLPPYSWVVEHLVLPHFTPFGYGVLIAETTLAVLLLSGTLVRIAALLGVAQSLAIGLSVANAPGEWPWSYLMLVGIHVVLLTTASGSAAAVDAVRAHAAEGDTGTAVRLLRGWGVVLAVVALLGAVVSLGSGIFASRGASLGSHEISLGSYNLLGALALAVVAGFMVIGAASRRRELVMAAGGVGVVAAVSIYLQLTRTHVWLGGTNTTAAVFLTGAAVAFAAGAVLRDAAVHASSGVRAAQDA